MESRSPTVCLPMSSRIAAFKKPISARRMVSMQTRQPETPDVLLSVDSLAVAYGKVAAVQGISFDLRKGEVLALLGANGAGKSSVVRALMGMAPMAGGTIRFRGQNINALRPDQRIALGLAYAPEGRRVFGDLTGHENLQMGGYLLSLIHISEPTRLGMISYAV